MSDAKSFNLQNVKLTETVQKGGCAAKVAAAELRKILAQVEFPPKEDRVLVDGGLFDDAAIYQLSEELALVQTLDFFTPIVNSPRTFGRIAAANALSDVYAMGGVPKTAMAILGFPLATMENDIAVAVLQGACDILREAKVNFVGGHSIDDETLKFGLSVTGLVRPQAVWSNAKAQVGDVLVLTKALGTGTLCAGLKNQSYTEESIVEALGSMSQINNVPDFLAASPKLLGAIHAATDITGFGLLGHCLQMAEASQVSFAIDFSQLPIFALALGSLAAGNLTKAHRTNGSYVEGKIDWHNLASQERLITVDPQTSGGLLLSVAPEVATVLVDQLKNKFPRTSIVGRVLVQDVPSRTVRFI